MTEAFDPSAEQPAEDAAADDLAVTEAPEAARLETGDPRVDAVLEDLDALHDLPVADHAPVFEQAHDRLREALDPDRESV